MRTPSPISSLATTALAALLVLSAQTASAQFRGSGGRVPTDLPRNDNGSETVARSFSDMARLDPLLKDLKLEKVQKDSLKSIESTYKRNFSQYGDVAKKMVDGGTRDPEGMRRLREDAMALHEQEVKDARAVLTAEQATSFDANVVKAQEDEAKRQQERRDRRPAGGGGGRGGMAPPAV